MIMLTGSAGGAHIFASIRRGWGSPQPPVRADDSYRGRGAGFFVIQTTACLLFARRDPAGARSGGAIGDESIGACRAVSV